MRYRLTERDRARIEAWARKTNLHAILSFIESLPRKLEIRPSVLVGSNGNRDILVEGMATRSSVSRVIRNLDEPFNPDCPFVFTHSFTKQKKDLSAEIYGTMAATLAQGFEKLCFLEATGQCQRGIVRAHLIQEALLREIAVNGHVLQFNLFGRRSPKEDFRNWPQPVGVDRASTFSGFCAFHDHQVFRPIEEGPFVPTPEALFLHAYRALCATLYTNKYRFEMVKATAAALNASGLADKEIQQDIAFNELDTDELVPIKQEWDRHLAVHDFAPFEHLALSCPKTPDIVGALFFAPPKNFRHERVQDSKVPGALDWLACTVIPRRNAGGLVLISAAKGGAAWANLTASLLAYPPEKRTMAIVNYLLCYFGEQLILAPKWWEQLAPDTQESIVNAWAAGYYPRHFRGLCDWGPLVPVA